MKVVASIVRASLDSFPNPLAVEGGCTLELEDDTPGIVTGVVRVLDGSGQVNTARSWAIIALFPSRLARNLKYRRWLARTRRS